MIRLNSSTIGGPAYLSFMGNEFEHPKVSSSFLAYVWQHNDFTCAGELSSQCRAMVSHIHFLIATGIFWKIMACKTDCLLSIRSMLLHLFLCFLQFHTFSFLSWAFYCWSNLAFEFTSVRENNKSWSTYRILLNHLI